MKNNLPIPFPSTLDDVDSLCNWMREYQDYYDTHIEDEKIKKSFTFTLVKLIHKITFALNKDGCGPSTNAVIDEALDYLKSVDNRTGKPLMRHFEVRWQTHSSVQVTAKTEKEAIEQAICLAEEEPGRVDRHFHDSKITAEEVQV